MSARGRTLLIVLPLVAAAIAFWVLAISPKRQKASELETQVSDLQAQVDEQEQLAAEAEAARADFPRAYRRLVVLGKATPEDDDTSSLLVQLNRIAANSGVKFLSLQAEAGEAGAAAPAPATPQTPADTAEQSEQQVENVEAASEPTPAPTEASAALLPIGASIGPAGLPVMKYALRFEGDFFHLADFLAGLDDLVRTRADGSVGVRGRLVTVDSFELAPGAAASSGDPLLSANFTVTTYVTPMAEGATGGASPAGPAPVTEEAPVSAPPSGEPTTTASTGTP